MQGLHITVHFCQRSWSVIGDWNQWTMYLSPRSWVQWAMNLVVWVRHCDDYDVWMPPNVLKWRNEKLSWQEHLEEAKALNQQRVLEAAKWPVFGVQNCNQHRRRLVPGTWTPEGRSCQGAHQQGRRVIGGNTFKILVNFDATPLVTCLDRIDLER